MLVQTDQLSNKYGGSFTQSQNIQHVLMLVRILAQIGEFYLRHDKINDAENCCQEISFIHPMSYLHIYLVSIQIKLIILLSYLISFKFIRKEGYLNINKSICKQNYAIKMH
jgi:hypothetical protein